MFSSSTVNNASPILSNVDNPLSIFVDDMNLISKQDDPLGLPTYYHLLSPLFHNEIDTFDDFFTHQYHFDQLERSTEQVLKTTSSAITDDSSMVDDKMGSNKVEHEIINTSTFKKPSASSHGSRRRRTSKKDRHSKIKTAQGLRDRRMRLSLEVAHPFFKLQDMLGYDKASRTVEWLLLNSKPAIEELIVSKKQTSPSGLTKCTISSASDCEVESTTIDQEKKNNSKGKRSSPLSSSASKSTVVPKEISKPEH